MKMAITERLRVQLLRLTLHMLAQCSDQECLRCGELVCPHDEPLHFHHDGCPACDYLERGK
jgi:hypothetical protein